jgi:hypothetical protein
LLLGVVLAVIRMAAVAALAQFLSAQQTLVRLFTR